jgi:hypothetical protein
MNPLTRHHLGILLGQAMWRKTKVMHPTLAEVGKFIDWKG